MFSKDLCNPRHFVRNLQFNKSFQLEYLSIASVFQLLISPIADKRSLKNQIPKSIHLSKVFSKLVTIEGKIFCIKQIKNVHFLCPALYCPHSRNVMGRESWVPEVTEMPGGPKFSEEHLPQKVFIVRMVF